MKLQIRSATVILALLAASCAESATKAHVKLAEAHAKIAENIRLTNAFNLDRRQAVIAAISLVNDALMRA